MKKVIRILKELNQFRKTFGFRIMWYHFLEKILTKLAKFPLKFLQPLVSKGFIAKHNAILSFLEKDFREFLNNYPFASGSTEIEKAPKQIFALWFQGREAAPPLVRATLKSQEEFAKLYGYDYIFLDQENLEQYFQIPSELSQKVANKEIDYIKLSDLIRCSLLAELGGVWFDSTLYVTKHSEAAYLQNKFYTIPARGKEWYPKYVANNRWAMFCISGSKGNLIFKYLRDMQIAYFSKYSLPIDYFLIDYLLDIGYRHSLEIRNQIDAVPHNNQGLYFIANHINETVDEMQLLTAMKETQLFKCSYKLNEIMEGDTYYHRLINQKLDLPERS